MSLRSKVVILLSAVVLLYAAIDHFLQRTLVYRNFVALEEAGAQKNIQRVSHALDSEIEHIRLEASGWATSDEVYRLAASAGHTDSDIFAQGPQMALEAGAIHLLYVCDMQGGKVFRCIYDGTPQNTEIKLREFPDELHTSHPLLCGSAQADPVSGVYMTEAGAMLVAALPIVGSKPEYGSRGTLIAGRFLDAKLLDALRKQTETSFDLWAIDDPLIPEADREVLDDVAASDDPVLRAVDDERLSAYMSRADIRDLPVLLFRANLDREATKRGNWAVRYALLSTVSAGLLMMLVLLIMLQRTVLKPLAQLTQHAVTIGRSDDFTRRIGSGAAREDEVGILAREFDSMIEKVAQSRAALVDTARAAGMSEIATGVLHNVGNVLNSVNVSANLVAQKARGAGPDDLKKVMDLLRPSADDLAGFIQRDPRGKHLYPLLDSLTNQLVSEQSVLLREVESLTTGIEHIKELVQAQQGYAGRAGVREVLSVPQLIDSALAITERGVPGSKQIEIVREFEELEALPVDRHRLMEIFVNLIQNARQSLLDSSTSPARMTLRLSRAGGDRLRIEVIDNGVGIPAENLSRVFNHGFTTKKGGHGFGLHASANASTEMGGKLSAYSAGPGQGATFVLEFPVPASAVAGAAA